MFSAKRPWEVVSPPHKVVGGALHVPRARERESPTPYPPGLVILGFRVLLKPNLPRSLVVRAAGGLV